MFAPASQGKATFLHRAIHSADLADLDGWLIGGWSEAVYNKGFFALSLEVSWWLSLNLTMQLMMSLYIRCNNFLAHI